MVFREDFCLINLLSILLIVLCVMILFVFPLMTLLVYRKGLTDGIDLIKHNEIKQIETPKFKLPVKKEEKQEDLIASGLNNLMTYDGNPPKGV